MNVCRNIKDLLASAPTGGDGKSDSLPDRAEHWLFAGRGSVASTVSHMLEQDDDIVGAISELASQPWALATDPSGPCHKLWVRLHAVFRKIEKASKGAKPDVSLPSDCPLLLQLASAKRESRLDHRPSRDGGLVAEKVWVESCRAGRALTEVARDLAGMTREPLLEPVDWYDPESRLQPLSRCVQVGQRSSVPSPTLTASFPYPALGDVVSCAVLNRLVNAVDLAKQLASLCEVKRLHLQQLGQMADESRGILWDCPEAEERQHAAALLQLGLLRPAASSLLSLLPFDSSPEIHDDLRLAVQRRLGQAPSAVEDVVRALEWLQGRVLPSGEESVPLRGPPGEPVRPEDSVQEVACEQAKLLVYVSGKVMFHGREVDLMKPGRGRARHAIPILRAIWKRQGDEITGPEMRKNEKNVTTASDQQRRYLSRFRACLRNAIGPDSGRGGKATGKTKRKTKKTARSGEQEALHRWIRMLGKSREGEGKVVSFRLEVPVEDVWFEPKST